MAAVTKSVNGVVATLDPAVFQSLGPSRQQIEFTSLPSTAASLPITIRFDRPVNSFSVDVVGITFQGHLTRIYNNNGQLIETIRTAASQPDQGSGGSIERVAYTNDSDPISRVELIPAPADYVGYRGLNVTMFPGFGDPPVVITPTEPIPNPVPPPVITPPVVPPQQNPPPPTVAPPRYINLADVVVLDALVIDRQYIKGSLRNIAPAKFNVRNTSSEVEVQVALSGLAGVSFDPANFTLAKNGIQEITVNFDVPTIDGLPEGINTVNAAINLNSNTAVFDPLPPPPAPVPPAPPVPVPAPIPQPIPQLPPTVIETLPPPPTAEIPLVQIRNNDDFPNPPVLISQPDEPPVIVPPGDPTRRFPDIPVVVNPAPPPVLTPWVDGTGAGGLNYGTPPAGWVQDPFGGAWYPSNDPFVQRDFDRAARPGTIVSAIDNSRGTFDPNPITPVTIAPPVLIAPPPDLLPPPPPEPPAPPPPYIPPQDTFFSGGGGGGDNRFFEDGGGIRDLQTDFMI